MRDLFKNMGVLMAYTYQHSQPVECSYISASPLFDIDKMEREPSNVKKEPMNIQINFDYGSEEHVEEVGYAYCTKCQQQRFYEIEERPYAYVPDDCARVLLFRCKCCGHKIAEIYDKLEII